MLFSAPLLLAFTSSGCSKESAPAPSAPVTAAAFSPPAEPDAVESEQAVPGKEGDPDEGIDLSASTNDARGGAGLVAEATGVLETMTASSYSHETHVAGTVWEVDCSGFVDYLLARVAPAALRELRTATVKRPLAKHYVAFLTSGAELKTWRRVLRIAELAPGDIVTWDKPEDVVSTNTGHVMIVGTKPELRKDGTWAIPVIDSTAAPHGSTDARKGTHTTGIGRGVIVLEADSTGAPIAYHWSELRSSHRHLTTIALGRVL